MAHLVNRKQIWVQIYKNHMNSASKRETLCNFAGKKQISIMVSFECDYNNGACQQVMDNLVKYNNAKPTPYGFDEFSERAKDRIREACGLPDAQIFFLTGGTQTNATTIDSMLYQYEGVICVGSGHINVHEAGAVEFTEHKIITIPDIDGKMEAATLDKYLDDYMHDGNKDHAVHPGLVYITFPTELGTLYSARELDHIYKVCQQYNIPLYIDGARLGYGLMAEGNDVTLPYLARHCDVFYIGGTKIGALCGEAVVFTNRKAHKHFFSIQKQHGALSPALRTRHQDGHADEGDLQEERIPVFGRLAHQPAVRHHRQ